MRGRDGTCGVDWTQATEVGYALLLSPLVGFVCAALLLLVAEVRRSAIRRSTRRRKATSRRRWWIRGLLILTCTGVSFAHGSNDGQKGMGLIMLILIGTVPTAYALNRALPDIAGAAVPADARMPPPAVVAAQGRRPRHHRRPAAGRDAVCRRTHKISEGTYPSLAVLVDGRRRRRSQKYGSLDKVPADSRRQHPQRHVPGVGGDPLPDEGQGSTTSTHGRQSTTLKAYKGSLDSATKFIPTWVKIAVAIALGLGTMIGWKRIVVTVGEKIGKTHLTYAPGRLRRTGRRWPPSARPTCSACRSRTTHVLSSGVAGTMAANGSGLQMATIRNLLMAWVLTLPAAIMLSGSLYVLFSNLF